MSFFGSVANEENLGSFEVSTNLAPIPKGTQVLANCEEAKWDSYNDENYVSLKWVVIQPEAYKNRIVFQKIKLEEKDENKRNRALRMLAAIDANAGGKLMAAGARPTNESLASALMHKPMVLKLDVWSIDKEADGTVIPEADRKSGNWIVAVSPRKGAAATKPTAAKKPEPVAADSFDDDIPF